MSADKNSSSEQNTSKPCGYGTVPVSKSDDTPSVPLSYGTVPVVENDESDS